MRNGRIVAASVLLWARIHPWGGIMTCSRPVVALVLVFGFVNMLAAETWTPYEDTYIPGTLSGTVQQGTVFRTASGNTYQVADKVPQLVLELQPRVVVFRSGDLFRLHIKGISEGLVCTKLNPDSARVEKAGPAASQLPAVVESVITSDFDGLAADKTYTLSNGQTWKQTETWIWRHIAMNPKVLIYKSGDELKMKVEGVDHAVTVRRVK